MKQKKYLKTWRMRMSWIDALPVKKRRGSFPRCLQLVDGSRSNVAKRLTELVALNNVFITSECQWMPVGIPVQITGDSWDLSKTIEAELTDVPFVSDDVHRELKEWWLVHTNNARVPNWDIASEAIINGKKGLLLVEAKAHSNELKTDGKPLKNDASPGSKDNHKRIAVAINEANDYINKETVYKWGLSHDSHYQLSNRFAWSWKLATMGIPVVLVYLGFLNAEEMKDIGTPFSSDNEWLESVLNYSKGIVPEEVWEQDIKIKDTAIIPLIRSIEISLAEI